MVEKVITVNINQLNSLVAQLYHAESVFALEAHTWNADIKLGAGAILNIDFSIREREVRQIADNSKAETDEDS